MKAGFSEADITPAPGMEKPGNYQKSYASGVRDPLKVRAAVFDDGHERLAIVGIDTCTISTATVHAARRLIYQRCGIKMHCITIAASHTHSGGPLFGFLASEFDAAPDLLRKLASEFSPNIHPEYNQRAIEQIAAAVCAADQRKETVLLGAGVGREDQVSFNRRFKMKNGRVYTHPGKGNPEIIAPAGPIDPDVAVIGAWRANGQLAGCIVNFACHPTIINDRISADWIFFMEQTVQAQYAEKPVCVFLNGACGDVTQVDNQSRREPEFGDKWAARVGTRVGAEAVKVLAAAERSEHWPLSAASKTLALQRRKPSREKLDRSLAVVEEALKAGKKRLDTTQVFAKESLLLDYLVKKCPAIDVEVQAVRIGAAGIVTNPSEYFCGLGLAIKKESPFDITMIATMTNGSVGYVPDEEAFLPNGGGYETALTTYSNLETTAGSKIRDESIVLARTLPIPPNAPAANAPGMLGAEPGKPWDYGVRGPDLD